MINVDFIFTFLSHAFPAKISQLIKQCCQMKYFSDIKCPSKSSILHKEFIE